MKDFVNQNHISCNSSFCQSLNTQLSQFVLMTAVNPLIMLIACFWNFFKKVNIFDAKGSTPDLQIQDQGGHAQVWLPQYRYDRVISPSSDVAVLAALTLTSFVTSDI
jgi:hypothetical protein